MKISSRMIAVFAILFASTASADLYQPGEVIVKYRDDSVRLNSQMDVLYNQLGVEEIEFLTGALANTEHLYLDGTRTVDEAIGILMSNPNVEFAHPNYILSIPELNIEKQMTDLTQDAEEGEPCLIPGLPFPPGCDDSGGGGGGGGDIPCLLPGVPAGCTGEPLLPGLPGLPGNPGGGGGTPVEDPALAPAPDEGSPMPDPDLEKLWGLKMIKAQEAWDINAGDKKIVVAVIDTGIDYNHQDLAFNVWRNPKPSKDDIVGYDFLHDDPLPFDDQGHGSHTSGTIGAVGGNGTAIAGVAKRVSIMGLKFLSSSGSGDMMGAVKSIDYATEHGAKIMSNSWGGRIPAAGGGNALEAAIKRAQDAGVLFVAAAGNEGVNNDDKSRASFPAAYDLENIVAVAATDSKDGLANFSNYGVASTDLGAPGVNIYSLKPGNEYATHSGTSMACPHVAGAAAVIWANNPDLTYQQVKKILLDSSDKIDSLKGKTVSGGRLNVYQALRSME